MGNIKIPKAKVTKPVLPKRQTSKSSKVPMPKSKETKITPAVDIMKKTKKRFGL